MAIVTQSPRRGGRARPTRDDDRAHQIRETVIEMVGRLGYESVTVDGVSAAAGVSKATIYRRWPTKAELVVDAVRGSISVPQEPEETGELRSDLISLLTGTALGIERDANFFVALLDASRRHDDVRAILVTQFREPGKSIDRIPLARAIARGDVTEECTSLFLDEIAMPMLIHRLVWHESLDGQYIEQIVDHAILPALAAYRA